jgi:hypothetical protein
MLWIILAILAIAGGFLARRRSTNDIDEEPWRASLREPDDDEPLDIEEIRNAEEEWLASDAWDADSEDSDWK